MSFNPDDPSTPDMDTTIRCLREENDELKKQVEELSTRLSRYELNTTVTRQGPQGPVASRTQRTQGPQQSPVATNLPNRGTGFFAAASTTSRSSVGRKSIPFDRRNAKQHQGRMAYLLKKLEGNTTVWTQDSIADLQAYFVSSDIAGAGSEFFQLAVVALSGENGAETITDIDTFLAILQS